MPEEAGVVAVGVVQLLPQLLGVHVEMDVDGALVLHAAAAAPAELAVGYLLTRRSNLFTK